MSSIGEILWGKGCTAGGCGQDSNACRPDAEIDCTESVPPGIFRCYPAFAQGCASTPSAPSFRTGMRSAFCTPSQRVQVLAT